MFRASSSFFCTWAVVISYISQFHMVTAAVSTLPVVTVEGVPTKSQQIRNFLASATQEKNLHFISAINCDLSNGCGVLNKIFEADIDPSFKGVELIVKDGESTIAVVYTKFGSMFSSKFCGSKATDLCRMCSSVACIVISGKDFSENVFAFDQIFKRLLDGNVKQSTPVIVIIDTSDLDKESLAQFEATHLNVLSSVLSGLGDSANQFEVKLVDKTNIESVKEARRRIEEIAKSRNYFSTEYISTLLVETWTSIAEGFPKPVYSQAEREAVLLIESSFTEGLATIEALFSPWQDRVSAGKLVGKFGDRVERLLKSVLKTFTDRTAGSLTVRERGKRADQLRDNVKSLATLLFRQQLLVVENRITESFKRSLLQLSSKTSEDYAEDVKKQNRESEEQALRNALFEFKASVSELEVEAFGLTTSPSLVAEFSASLQNTLAEFPESAAAKLESMRRLEAVSKKPPRRRKGRGKASSPGVNIGLNLVGMLRPPGFGNLQGYVGYSTGFLGLPLDLLLGVQNDGDSPEIVGEDREFPLLRIQPKIHFDVDL